MRRTTKKERKENANRFYRLSHCYSADILDMIGQKHKIMQKL